MPAHADAVAALPELRCRFVLRFDNPIVRDHRVHGVRTMPGVTFLDVLYRSLRQRGVEVDQVELRDVLFVEPVVVTETFDRELQVEILRHAEGYRVTADSRRVHDGRALDDHWTRHLEGELLLGVAFPDACLALDDEAGPDDVAEDIEHVYRRGRAAEIEHQAFMRCAGHLRRRADQLLAELHLGTEARAHAAECCLHPALLDAATMQSYALVFDGTESAPRPLIPMHIGSFRAKGALGDTCRALVRRRSTARADADIVQVDIDLYDQTGALRARFERLALKRVRARLSITRLAGEAAAGASDPVAVRASTSSHAQQAPACDQAPETALARIVLESVGACLGSDTQSIDPTQGFYDLGLESTQLLQIVRWLEERLGRRLYPTLLFEYNTVERLARHLAEQGLEPVVAGPKRATGAADVTLPSQTLCWASVWQADQAAQPSAWTPDGNVLVLDSRGLVYDALRRRAGHASGRLVRVSWATQFERPARTHLHVAPTAADCVRLLAALAADGLFPRQVVHVHGEAGLDALAAQPGAALANASGEALAFAQAALAAPQREPIGILHVCCGADAAGLAAALAGFARTLELENPRLTGRALELASASDGGPEWSAAALAEALWQELGCSDEPLVRRALGQRWLRRHRSLDVAAPDDDPGKFGARSAEVPRPLRARGVYLISGGNGGLGRTVARWLVRATQGHVVLCGRAAEADLAGFEHDGHVHYVQADVTRPDQVEALVDHVRTRFGALHGVVHAAGLLADALVPDKTLVDLRRVLAPKVAGCLHLDEATRDEPLDFFVLCSSITSVLGNAGQADYAAANGYLNAAAERRERARAAGTRQGRSVAIAWPLWRDGGMQVGPETHEQFGQRGQVALPDEEGLRVLWTALRQDAPALLVLHGEPRRLRQALADEPGLRFRLADPERATGITDQQSAAAAPRGCGEAPAARALAQEPIAIIGLAGRYPMAADLRQFWDNLCRARDCVTEIPPERWPLEGFFDPERGRAGRSYARWGAFLEDADCFDPAFFRLTPREAESMDPQERLFLEAVWHVLEDAGYTPARAAREPVGVFVGVMFNQYQLHGLDVPADEPVLLPTSFASSVANRVSYFFDFRGPSLALDTMCSSSLTAIHQACESLRRGECALAIAGGVNVCTHPYKYLYLSQAAFLSSDGRCRSFGQGGDGYVPGEGVGALLLKPLTRALADGDRIHGLVSGSAVNHGGRASGYTTPNPAAQAEAIEQAFRRAGLAPEDIGYLEAHGTGTSLGDPVELAGLEKVFGRPSDGRSPCPIGSVKSNVGHLEAAAGIAGVTKALLQMRHGRLVPSLHAEPPNPAVPWEQAAFRVQRELQDWPRRGLLPRRTGVSAFGAGGANAHVVLEEAPPPPPARERVPGPQLVLLSARRDENLRALAARYLTFLEPNAADIDDPRLRRWSDNLRRAGARQLGVDLEALDPAVPLEEWGLDAADLRRLCAELAASDVDSPEPPALDPACTLNECVERLARQLQAAHPAANLSGWPGERLDLAEIAVTTQLGREAHEERLALVVDDVAGLRAALARYLEHGVVGVHVQRGRASRAGHEQAGAGAVAAALRQRDLPTLARLWVAGAQPDWRQLHGEHLPRRVELPFYPFTRQRCWVKTKHGPRPDIARALESVRMQPRSDAQPSPEASASTAPTPAGHDLPALEAGGPGAYLADTVFVPQWVPCRASAARTAPESGRRFANVVLIHAPCGAALARALAARHPEARVITLELGAHVPKTDASAGPLEAPALDLFRAPLLGLTGPSLVYFLGGLCSPDGEHDTDEVERLACREETGPLALLRCVKVLAERVGTEALALKIVTNSTWPVGGTSVSNPQAAGLWGLAQVIESEHSNISVTAIDLDWPREPATQAQAWQGLAELVASEPCERRSRVAYRAGLRYRQILYPADLPAARGTYLRADAHVLIVGGAGGVGFEIASWLVRARGARVSLLGRSAPSAERAEALQRLDPTGRRLAYFRADASDARSLQAALTEVRARFGAVHGVIHSALVQHDRLLKNMEESAFRASLAAKAGIAVRLYQALGHEPLDFMVFFSSVQSFLGDAGLGNYAAGCAFEDAYAHYLSERLGCRVRTLNWGFWGTAGAVATDFYRERLARRGYGCITPEAGLAAFERVLEAPLVQAAAIVARRDLLERLGVDFGQRVVAWPASELPQPSELQADLLPAAAALEAVSRFHAADQEMGLLAARWLLDVLRDMGAFQAPGVEWQPAALLRQLAVVPRYERLLSEALQVLTRAGLLRARAGSFALAGVPEPRDRAAAMHDLAARRPDAAVFVDLLCLCLPRYAELLRGELLATDLLFPKSATSRMERIYKGNEISDFYNERVSECVRAYVAARVPRLAPGEKLRLLEVGSGTGGTTEGVLRALRPYAEQLEYVYTDLSVTFLEHGKRHYGAEYPFMTFRRLDADVEFDQQGFEPGSYDLVMAANVLHASRDIRNTLVHVKAALKRGGWLVLNELTRVTVQATLTYGLFDGWWCQDDSARRLPGSPLLDAPGWQRLLAELGYRDLLALPAAHQTGLNFQHVLVAASDGLCLASAATRPAVTPARVAVPSTLATEPVSAPPASLAPAPDQRRALLARFEADLLALASETSGIALAELAVDQELGGVGFDSISFGLLSDRLNQRFGLDVSPATFYETPTLRVLAEKLGRERWPLLARHYQVLAAPPVAAAPQAPSTPPPSEAPRAAVRGAAAGCEPIAIVGMAGRLPGSQDLDEFWQHLIAGRDLVSEVPSWRWDWRDVRTPDGAPDQQARFGGFVADVEYFDPLFFGISPREAAGMDPQQRLFLQAVWTCLEDAGIAPTSLAGSDTGLFVGVGSSDYEELQRAAGLEIDTFGATANTHSILVNRISYLLDVHGPSEPINTGCSSSLVAVHRAVAALRNGDCELALAGGINLLLAPRNYLLLSRTGMLSPAGRCKTFDADADGFARGEGLGVVALMRASHAEARGHTIYGLVRGSAINHGGRARSLTAPNPVAQARMLVRAYDEAGVGPETVGYVETHGTGTVLGDPVEINGLKLAFDELFRRTGAPQPNAPYCALGAVKSNIGHLEAAAGIAGLLKVLLALKHRLLAPCAHVHRLNPHIQLDGSPFSITTEPQPWPRLRDAQGAEVARRAGVSSFGYGGVNAHVVLEEYAAAPRPGPAAAARIFVLSARTPAALRASAQRWVAFLGDEARENPDWTDLTYTLALGRDAHEQRLALVASSGAQALAILAPFAAEGAVAPGLHLGHAGEAAHRYGLLLEGEEGAAFLRVVQEQRKLDKLAALWVHGVGLDWTLLYEPGVARRVPLPTYAFERTRCWIAPVAPAAPTATAIPPAPREVVGDVPVEPLLYAPRWVPTEIPEADQRHDDRRFERLRASVIAVDQEASAQALSERDQARLEQVTLHWLLRTLSDEGLRFDVGRAWTSAQVVAQARALPKYERLIAELLRALSAGGLLRALDEGAFVASDVLALADPEAELQRLCAELPKLAGFERLVRRCLPALFPVLRGERAATDVLFPESSMELVQGVYRGNPVVDRANRLIAAAVAHGVQARLAGAEPVWLIEVGAGVGGASEGILASLAPYASRLRYVYTDVSNAFLHHARQHYAAEHAFLELALLDLEQDPGEQGFQLGSFDIVVASNVLHATRDLRATLARVRRLLKPGGWLVMNEATRSLVTITLSFGLLDGWWLHAGEDFRLPGSPLLPSAGWRRVLAETGFGRLSILPESTHEAPTQQIIVAEQGSLVSEVAPLTSRAASPAGGQWLIVYPPAGRVLASALAAAARADAQLVQLGTHTRWLADGHRELDAADAGAWTSLLASLPRLTDVCFLGGVGPHAPSEQGLEGAFERGEEQSVVALFRLVKGLDAGALGERSLSVRVLTSDACAPEGRPVANPFAAHLRGFVRSLRREFPCWQVTLIDLAWHDIEQDAARAAAGLLATDAGQEGELAWRGGRAFRQTLAPLALPAAARTMWRAGGVYLLLGGAGTIGLELAAALVRRHQARVVLVGRSVLDEHRRERLASLDPVGEQVVYVTADAADPEALARAADLARARFGGLHGVVHAAFVLRDRSLRMMDEGWLREGLASTRICPALARVFARAELDFLLVFSSIQSFLGNPGQSSYAATCTFKDAFVDFLRPRLAFPVRVINWGAWGDEGPAARYREWLERAGARPLTVAAGLEIVHRTLQHDAPQVVAVDGTPEFLASLGVEHPGEQNRRPSLPVPAAAREALQTAPARDPRVAEPTFTDRLAADVCRLLAETAQMPPADIDLDLELGRYGYDSISYTLLAKHFNETFELGITPAYLYGLSTGRDLVAKLAGSHGATLAAWYARQQAARSQEPLTLPTGQAPAARSALVTDGEPARSQPNARARAAEVRAPQTDAPTTTGRPEAIAIVGMAGLLPQADDLEEFWQHLLAERDLITEIPADRWDWRRLAEGVDARLASGLKWGGFLRRVDAFDAQFFGISAREAAAMDPQQRLFLQVAWACLENAALRPSTLAGTNTGVFVGVGSFDYSDIQQRSAVVPDGYNTIGRAHCILANRVSYLLDLHGPSEAIDTACSSSLVALNRAVEAIQQGRCDLALAGGVNVILSPMLHLDLGRAGMLSPDGRCRTFDRRANGFVRAEGAGAVLLKPLARALADGDPIHGLIRATAVNHGGRTNALTAPNPKAQTALLVEAYRRAGVDPRTVGYLETHGTGTELGDPIEIDALKTAFEQLYDDVGAPAATRPHCALGALKSNLGHLECASGIAGLLKVLLCLRHRTLPRNLHFEAMNPYVQLEGSPFHLARERQPWTPLLASDGRAAPLRAGVSAFGVGGVNAHVVLEEHVLVEPGPPDTRPQLIVLSARSQAALRAYARALLAWLTPALPAASSAAHPMLVALLAETLHVRPETLGTSEQLGALGLEPREARSFASRAAASAGVLLPPDLVWEELTLDDLAQCLTGASGARAPGAERPAIDLAALAYTLQTGREAWSERLAIIAADAAELGERLTAYLDNAAAPAALAGVLRGSDARARRRPNADNLQPAPERSLAEHSLDELARRWVLGESVDWAAWHAPRVPRRIALPTYPFQGQRHWLEGLRPFEATAGVAPRAPLAARSQAAHLRVEQVIREALAEHLGCAPSALPGDGHFAEYGVDSLGLRLLGRELEARLGLDVPATHFHAAPSIDALTSKLAAELASPVPSPVARRQQGSKRRRARQRARSSTLAKLVREVRTGALSVEQALAQVGPRAARNGRVRQ